MTDGESRITAAEAFGAHHETWPAGSGPDAEPRPSPTPGPADTDLRKLGGLLAKGSKARGWHNRLWTTVRVARPIKRHPDIRYRPERAREVLDGPGVVRRWLAEHPGAVAEDFPGYAPDPNPDEGAWWWAEYGRPADLAAEDGDERSDRGGEELVGVGFRPDLLGGRHPSGGTARRFARRVGGIVGGAGPSNFKLCVALW